MAKIKKVLELGNGYNIVEMDNGKVERRSGNWNVRNNNPGNIENGDFAKSKGALDLTAAKITITNPDASPPNRFAVFPDFETGRAAKKALLFERDSYKNKSIADAITRYAPPKENPTSAYIAAVVSGINNTVPNSSVTVDTVLNTLTEPQREAMLDAMQRVEGGGGGGDVATTTPARAPNQPSVTDIQNAFTDYISRVYIKPFIDNKRFVEFANAIDSDKLTLSSGTTGQTVSIKKLIQESNAFSVANLAGETALLSSVAEVQSDLAVAQQNIATKLSGFTPSEQYFLLSQNYFEIYPDRMRAQMSKNAGNGINANYSHAWRAPGKLAITATLTIPGASGFRIGQIFWIGRTYESYKKFGAFQLFGLTETIDINRGWTTELYARYNAIPVSKIQNLQSE